MSLVLKHGQDFCRWNSKQNSREKNDPKICNHDILLLSTVLFVQYPSNRMDCTFILINQLVMMKM